MLRIGLLLAIVIFIGVDASANDQLPGKTLYQNGCAACHGAGAEGNEVLHAPALAAQHTTYLRRQLQNYANGLRGSDERDEHGKQMVAVSEALPVVAREQIVSYLASLKPLESSQTEGNIKQGKKHYKSYCASCHGPAAAGNEMLSTPRLRSLSGIYLRRQYRYFLDGVRGHHPDDLYGRQMKSGAANMRSQDKLNDVVAYLSSM